MENERALFRHRLFFFWGGNRVKPWARSERDGGGGNFSIARGIRVVQPRIRFLSLANVRIGRSERDARARAPYRTTGPFRPSGRRHYAVLAGVKVSLRTSAITVKRRASRSYLFVSLQRCSVKGSLSTALRLEMISQLF